MRLFQASRPCSPRQTACLRGWAALVAPLLLASAALPLFAQSPAKTPSKTPDRSAKQLPGATVVAAPADTAAAPAVPPTPSQQPARAAVVSYANGKLLVQADNSGLNRTLREISRAAGIKLTGSVPDDRVYGTYGPDSPAHVLSELIDGTGSNMLFVQGTGTTSSELILTPRTGAASPPSTKQETSDDEQDAAPTVPAQTPAPAFQPQPLQHTGPRGVPQGGLPPSDSSDPNQAAPNGVRTPQQIYDQLQRMRQGLPPDQTQQTPQTAPQ